MSYDLKPSKKDHTVRIEPEEVDGQQLYYLRCDAAEISQFFDLEDLVSVIKDLPELLINNR